MTELSRRTSLALGVGAAVAGPAVLGANLVGAGAAFGPAYPWRFLAWGRRENEANAAYFARRAVAAPDAMRALPLATDEAGVARALAEAGTDGVRAFLRRTQTTSFVVARAGRVVFEAYANGGGRAVPAGSRSMAKSVLALLVGAALREGRIGSVDAPMEVLLPEVPGLHGAGVRLRHLLQMGGGLAYRGDGAPLGRLTAAALWGGTQVAYFVAELRRYLATARAGAAPGTRFVYDDRSAQLVGLALERAFGMPVSQVLSTRLWGPMGAEYPASWALNGAADGLEKLEGGIDAAALDWLRLGLLVLEGGRGAVASDWVDVMTAPMVAPAGYFDGFAEFGAVPGLGYGLFWWTLPGGGCFAHGLFGQVVYVSRRHGMVVVRTGTGYGGVAHWPSLIRRFCEAYG